MKSILRHKTDNNQREFFDKNGNLIKLGDELIVPEKDRYFYKDFIIIRQNGELGLILNFADFFVPLKDLVDTFFETCEIKK